MYPQKSFHSSQRWIRFQNNEDLPIPPYGFIQAGDIGFDSGSRLYLSAQEPPPIEPGDLIGYQAGLWSSWQFFFNGPVVVLPGDFGYCTQDFPLIAAFYYPTTIDVSGEFSSLLFRVPLPTAGAGFRLITTLEEQNLTPNYKPIRLVSATEIVDVTDPAYGGFHCTAELAGGSELAEVRE